MSTVDTGTDYRSRMVKISTYKIKAALAFELPLVYTEVDIPGNEMSGRWQATAQAPWRPHAISCVREMAADTWSVVQFSKFDP